MSQCSPPSGGQNGRTLVPVTPSHLPPSCCSGAGICPGAHARSPAPESRGSGLWLAATAAVTICRRGVQRKSKALLVRRCAGQVQTEDLQPGELGSSRGMRNRGVGNGTVGTVGDEDGVAPSSPSSPSSSSRGDSSLGLHRQRQQHQQERQQHLQRQERLQQQQQQHEQQGQQEQQQQEQQSAALRATTKAEWDKIVKDEDLAGALAVAASMEGKAPKIWLLSLLQLAAKRGSASEFAEALRILISGESKLSLNGFVKVMNQLTERVPAPVAMIRLALNLAIPRNGQPSPLVPKVEILSEQVILKQDEMLFEGCVAPGHFPAEDGMPRTKEERQWEAELHRRAIRSNKLALSSIDPTQLMGRVGIEDEARAAYFGHFSTLLHLDYMEELIRVKERIERPPRALELRGQTVRFLVPGSIQGQPDRVRLELPPDFNASRLRLGLGEPVILSRGDPLNQGALAIGTVVWCPCPGFASGYGDEDEDEQMMGGDVIVVKLDGGADAKESGVLAAAEVRLDKAENYLAYRRQMEALRRLASLEGERRYPLWDLLSVGQVGGENVDSWAAKMRKALDENQRVSLGESAAEAEAEDSQAEVTVSAEVQRLKELAEEEAELSPEGRIALEQVRKVLQGEGTDLGDIQKSLGQLNESQKQAVLAALAPRLTIVQGPPGTGKTHVSAQLLRLWAQVLGVRPLLVTSHNNVAVDNIAENAHACGLRVVRIGRPEKINTTLAQFSLSNLAADILKEGQFADKSLADATFLAKQAAVKAADVVCVTTISSATGILKDVNFGAILMDE
ncbi:unnamed protein product, partial [Polarella glacialis]